MREFSCRPTRTCRTDVVAEREASRPSARRRRACSADRRRRAAGRRGARRGTATSRSSSSVTRSASGSDLAPDARVSVEPAALAPAAARPVRAPQVRRDRAASRPPRRRCLRARARHLRRRLLRQRAGRKARRERLSSRSAASRSAGSPNCQNASAASDAALPQRVVAVAAARKQPRHVLVGADQHADAVEQRARPARRLERASSSCAQRRFAAQRLAGTASPADAGRDCSRGERRASGERRPSDGSAAATLYRSCASTSSK